MIQERNLAPNLRSKIGAGQYNVGWNGAAANGLGGFWYVDPAGDVEGDGRSWDEPFNSLTDALTVMKKWDTIFCAPGAYTGNHNTPLNAVAPFCAIIGMRQTSLGLAAWAGATTQTLPIITVKARGWRISGFEFDNPTTSGNQSAGVELYKLNATYSTLRGDYLEVDHCLFTGGKTGFMFYGGGTYAHIHDCRFDLLAGTGTYDGAIMCSDSGHQCPTMCLIENNDFMGNDTHIGMGNGTARGFNDSIIRGNLFQKTGYADTCTLIMDIRSNGGGNMIIGNWFDCTVTEYANDSGTLIYTNSSDEGMQNWCNDGVLTSSGEIAH